MALLLQVAPRVRVHAAVDAVVVDYDDDHRQVVPVRNAQSGGAGARRGAGPPTHLHMVSTSMPENPKALSPSTQTTFLPLGSFVSSAAAAMAKPRPTPIVPNVPASNLNATGVRGWDAPRDLVFEVFVRACDSPQIYTTSKSVSVTP